MLYQGNISVMRRFSSVLVELGVSFFRLPSMFCERNPAPSLTIDSTVYHPPP